MFYIIKDIMLIGISLCLGILIESMRRDIKEYIDSEDDWDD